METISVSSTKLSLLFDCDNPHCKSFETFLQIWRDFHKSFHNLPSSASMLAVLAQYYISGVGFGVVVVVCVGFVCVFLFDVDDVVNAVDAVVSVAGIVKRLKFGEKKSE